MRLFRSHYNIFQVLLFFIAAVGFMGALAGFTLHIFLTEITSKSILAQVIYLILCVALPAFFSVFSFISMATKMPVIRLYNDRIDVNNLFSRKTIMLSEISEIYFGKVPFRFVIPYPLEGVMVKTKAGEESFIYDYYYFNTAKLKWILSQFIDENHQLTGSDFSSARAFKRNKVKYSEIRFEKFLTYKGIWWLTFIGIAFIVIILLPFAIALMKGKGFNMPIQVYIGMVGFFYLVFGYQLNYFKLSDKYLVVKHHLWLWREKIYRLDEIEEIVTEQPYNISISLRVITTGYKSKLYPAGSLSKKKWKELHQQLKSHGVKVRKETFY